MSSEQADRSANGAQQPSVRASVPGAVPGNPASNLRFLIWWQRLVRDGLPELGDGWTATRIPSGLRLSRSPEDRVAGAAADLVAPDAARLTLVVEAERPDGAVVAVVESALALLSPQGPRGLRLVLPLVDAALGQGLAEQHELDLVAPSGRVLITPNGLAVATGFHPGHPQAFWQWHRYRPGRPAEPCGALHPCPPWEQALVRRGVGAGKIPGMPEVHVRRVAGGLVLHGADERAEEVAAFVRVAGLVRPDPERLTVLVRSNGRDAAMLAALGELLGALRRAAPLRVRLLWPQAAAPGGQVEGREGVASGGQAEGLQALADRYGAEITAPDSEVHPDGPASLRAGAGPAGGPDGCWYRFSAGAGRVPLGPTLTLAPGPTAAREAHRGAAPTVAQGGSVLPEKAPAAEAAAAQSAVPAPPPAPTPAHGPAPAPASALVSIPVRAPSVVPAASALPALGAGVGSVIMLSGVKLTARCQTSGR